ncbi:MAG TPA: PQQ-binding-like beta-propeller repeat protein [Acidimicrobiia bacterium]|nr:PQQ-binding-like beta-propeller repeat protein [Acidimicrobiia bacterium]
METREAGPDLLSLVRAAGIPVQVGTAAVALESTPEEIMAVGARLVADGKLRESASGYSYLSDASEPLSPAIAAYMAGHLADAMMVEGGDRGDIGRLLVVAGRFAEAWRMLAEAATDPSAKLADMERLDLLELADQALTEAKLDGGELEGRVRLHLARLYRAKGESQAARGSIETALTKLQGEELVDALGFAASVADDLQHPQEAERWVALAELAALKENSLAKLGSLLTFHGRELSRLGFASEAEAALGKGNSLLLSHGSRPQRFYGRLNQAWVDLDQGQMRAAEAGFAHLREEAQSLEGQASQADKEAYWARTLFGIGRPDLALAAINRAHEMASSAGAMAPKFIAHLARAEGGLLFENWEQAREGAEAALDLALANLPAWENVCRYLVARAMYGLGSLDEARSQAEAALAATPVGADGIRWRLRIEELQLELSDVWNRRAAEDITDLFLQSRWLGAAVDLMTARAARDKDPEVAAEAAALALQIGNPVQAAKAVRAGNLWRNPLATPVLSAARGLTDHCPPDWYPAFLAGPEPEAALAAATEVTDEEETLLREKIAQALQTAGLSGDTILSPAQRRTAGLVHRRRPRRRSPLAWLAAAVAVGVIATGAAFLVVNLTAPDPVAAAPTTAAPRTTTTVPPIEARVIAAPDTGLTGTYAFRGDAGRSGVASGGFREVEGYYWRLRPGGSFVPTTSPVSYGRWVYVVTDENKLYGYELTGGRLNLVIQADNPITATPTIGQPAGSETVDPLMVFPTNDGVVHAFSAVRTGTGVWDYPTNSTVRAPALIIEQSVFVATTDGHIYAIDLQSGDLLWRYPAAEAAATDLEEAPSFNTAPAFFEGVVYVTSREGSLHAVDAASGEPLCPRPIDLNGTVNIYPSITEGAVFVGLENPSGIHAFAAGACGGAPAGYSAFYPSSLAVRLGLLATPDTMYVLEDRLLLAMLLDGTLWLDAAGSTPSPWDGGPFGAADIITTPPVLADGVLYVGSQDGMVHAVDAESGIVLWQFNAESAIRGELVVVPGAVVATTADGEIIAIAGQ